MALKNIPNGKIETATAMPDGTKRQCCDCLKSIEPGAQATRNQFGVLMHAGCPAPESPAAAASGRDFGDQVADEFDRQRGKGDPIDLALELGRSLAGSPIAHAQVAPASRDLGDLVCEAMGWAEPAPKTP